MKNNPQTPLYDALIQHDKRQPLALHVPGHKSGSVFYEKGKASFESLLALDLTELPGLDDLHAPTGVIRKAQELLTSFYQTDESRFLVGGSTVGNLAMVWASCDKGSTVLVQRNAHQSVLNAVKLAGAHPVFLAPKVDQASGLATVPAIETLERALDEYPEAKAVILTNPNYYGMTADLEPFICKSHQHGIPVLVDEAHGAHFVLGAPFPKSALSAGADAVVQSAHKTLPAMTMGAFIHMQGGRLNRQALRDALRMLQSSSPSYPIMASLDLARGYMAQLTKTDLVEIGRDIKQIRDKLANFPHFSMLGDESDAYEALDPLKITLEVRCPLSGFELANRLENEGVYPELADPDHVLFVLPLARFQDDERLVTAMKKALVGVEPTGKKTEIVYPEMPALSRPFEVPVQAEKDTVPLDKAEGYIAAQAVTPYPPGVPVIIEGEQITATQIAAVYRWYENGGRFQAGGEVSTEGIHVVSSE